MTIVAGGAGFIGSNIVKALNNKDITDILVVDNLKDGTKSMNSVDLDTADYVDKEDFPIQIMAGEELSDVEAILHEGARPSTTEWDDECIMNNNYQYSKELLHYCLEYEIPFLYVSSATTYGGRASDSIEPCECEKLSNVYSYSGFLFDEHVRQILPEVNSQIASFRYFDVYGPREGRKGSMANVTLHLNTQFNNGGSPRLFESSKNFKRDFVYVGDVADVSLRFLESGAPSIFNLGTGHAEPPQAVTDTTLAYHKEGQIEYIPFPNKLKGHYQAFTQVDLTNLRAAGYDKLFRAVTESVTEYMAWLNCDA